MIFETMPNCISTKIQQNELNKIMIILIIILLEHKSIQFDENAELYIRDEISCKYPVDM